MIDAQIIYVCPLGDYIFDYINGNLEWLAGHVTQTYVMK